MSTGNPKAYALLSVTDKAGIADLAKSLEKLGYGILSTGGTAKAIREAGVHVMDVAEFTGSPEFFDGRVKTLHPKVHGGILMDRSNPQHQEQAQELNIRGIDLVVVNFYQFAKEAKDKDMELAKAIEYIDIGGPTMLRAAAKNYENTAAVIDPSDYDLIIEELEKGELTRETRTYLAAKTFRTISQYDDMIASYFEKTLSENEEASIPFHLEKVQSLRYGENPQQKAEFYTHTSCEDGLQNARVLQGKELSYNNYLDLDAATAIVADFEKPMITIVKHNNPCGAALGEEGDLLSIYKKALSGDPKSAFGGIIACNREISAELAKEMSKTFLECIAAPSYSAEAKEVFAKKKNLRILECPFLESFNTISRTTIKSIRGGYLVQDVDTVINQNGEWKTVTENTPSEQEAKDLAFAMNICKHVKSNAIIYVKNEMTITIGAGQMSRIDSAEFAAGKAVAEGKSLEGAVMASDAFFPFRDTVDHAAKIGIKAIIQPGGSVRDQESIDACNEQGLSMVFTGNRHFKH